MQQTSERITGHDDFVSAYLNLLPDGEAPWMFHRWSALVGLGAWLERQCYFSHMGNRVFPNLYCMLIADAGVRKSTAIKGFVKLLKEAGYSTFSAQKTSKEQFLIDLAEAGDRFKGLTGSAATAAVFGDLGDLEDGMQSPMFCAPDEFNELFGNNILDFVSMLGTLWDYEGTFENKVKNSVSVRIPNPCISLLGGNTPSTLYSTFPSEVIGQGFFSRLIFVHSPPTGKKIAFPGKLEDESKVVLLEYLRSIKEVVQGELKLEPKALEILEEIYSKWTPIPDPRFASYANRRFTQLLKLITIHAASRISTTIEQCDVVRANTVLCQAEQHMSRGLGAFGKSKYSEASHKIVETLQALNSPMPFQELFSRVSNDLDGMKAMQDVINSLLISGKIQQVDGGFLAKREKQVTMPRHLLDPTYLTKQEKELT